MAHFTHEHLKKSHVKRGVYDRSQVLADWDAMRAEIASGKIDLITRRVSKPDQVASDDSGRPASFGFLEWAHN